MHLPSEVRHAARTLIARPGFSGAIVLSLGLALWLGTSIFSVAYGVLLRPLPYADPTRIVSLENAPVGFQRTPTGIEMGIAAPIRETRVLAERAMYTPGGSANLTGADRADRVTVVPVSDRFFATLGTSPLLGRTIVSVDDVSVAVLSFGVWQRLFGAERDVLGRSIRINGRAFSVIGVMPSAFSFPERTDVWISLPVVPDMYVNAFGPSFIGRLADNLTVDQAQTTLRGEVAAYYARRNVDVTDLISLVQLRDRLTAEVRPVLHLVVGGAAFVLVLGTANAVMLLVASVGRRRLEFGIRRALGARSRDVYRQLFLECLLLAIGSVAVGALAATWSEDVLRSLLPSTVPQSATLGVDAVSFVFTAIGGVLIALVSGVAAGARALRVNEGPMALGEARSTRGVEGRRLLRALVTSEVALAFVLATGAGLLTQSFLSAARVDLGFDSAALTTFRLQLPDASYPADRRAAFAERLLDDLRQIPGVSSAGIVNDLPLAAQMGASFRLHAVGRADSARGSMRVASPEYFATLGIALRSGRTFRPTDDQGAPRVLVVSEGLAKQLAPDGRVIGLRVQLLRDTAEIVGVVAGVRHRGAGEEALPEIYRPYAQNPYGSVSVAVRATGSVSQIVRDRLRALDPALPVFELRTMNDIVAASLAERRFALSLIGLFSVFGVGLAAFGVFAIASFSVTERMRELGIRIALGASRPSVLGLVLREGVSTAVVGTAAGAIGAAMLSPMLERLLFGVGARDGTTLVTVAVLLAGVAVVAGVVPAFRASRIDPIVTLRRE